MPGDYTLRGDVSSQFVSGLLFALPLLDGDSTLTVLPPVESGSYIDLTLSVLQKAGIRIGEVTGPEGKQERENGRAVLKNTAAAAKKTAHRTDESRYFRIPGRQNYKKILFRVEGDWSNGAYLFALNRLGGAVQVTGIDPKSLQGDRICLELFDRLLPGIPCAEAAAEACTQKEIDLSDCPDLGPVLFALAAASGKGGSFTGIRRLRLKESDRVRAMAEELEKFGIRAVTEENRFSVLPGMLCRPEREPEGHNDHRIVMALSLLCTLTGGTVRGAEAVGKSWPDFFSVLRSLGLTATEQYDT